MADNKGVHFLLVTSLMAPLLCKKNAICYFEQLKLQSYAHNIICQESLNYLHNGGITVMAGNSKVKHIQTISILG